MKKISKDSVQMFFFVITIAFFACCMLASKNNKQIPFTRHEVPDRLIVTNVETVTKPVLFKSITETTVTYYSEVYDVTDQVTYRSFFVPKQASYQVGQAVQGTVIFWDDAETFVTVKKEINA